MKFVITYAVGDSYTYSCEVNECVEYESLGRLVLDLGAFVAEHSGEGAATFAGIEFDPAHLSRSSYQVQSLDDWFEARKGVP